MGLRAGSRLVNRLLSRLRSRLSLPRPEPAAGPAPFLLNSVPKAGTNLLSKTVGLLPGVRSPHVSFLPADVTRLFPPVADPARPRLLIGVGADSLVDADAVERYLRALQPGQAARGHLPYSPALADLLRRLHLRSLLILRDPRDVAVSHVNYVLTNPNHRLHACYQALSPDQRLTATILGLPAPLPPPVSPSPFLLGVAARFEMFLPWLSQPDVYTTRFEALVGPQGGGSETDQLHALRAIAQHLDLPCDDALLQQVARQAFGGVRNFRRGLAGAWRDAFTPAHKAQFKAVAGDLLQLLAYETNYDW